MLELVKEAEERNAIITEWFRDDRIEHFLRLWAMRYPEYFNLGLKDDLKQEVFLWLLKRPLPFIREIRHRDRWEPFICRMILSHKKKSEFYKTHIGFISRTKDIDLFFDLGLVSEESKETDLLQECETHIPTLSYLERECLLVYANNFNEKNTKLQLEENGIMVSSHSVNALLKSARSKIQQSLLTRGVISKKSSFRIVNKVDDFVSYDKMKTHPFRVAQHIIRVVNANIDTYDVSWSIADKVLFAICGLNYSGTSGEINNYLKAKEPRYYHLFKSMKAKQPDISGHLQNFIYSGVLKKKQLYGNKKIYYFSEHLLPYLDSKSEPLIFECYLKYMRDKDSFVHIGKVHNLTTDQVGNNIKAATDIINMLYEERVKINHSIIE